MSDSFLNAFRCEHLDCDKAPKSHDNNSKCRISASFSRVDPGDRPRSGEVYKQEDIHQNDDEELVVCIGTECNDKVQKCHDCMTIE